MLEAGGKQEEDKVVVRKLIDMGFKITVTGGITVDLLPFFQDLPVSIIIAGRAIHQAADPAASAHEFRSTIHRLWGSSKTVSSGFNGNGVNGNTFLVDVAPKAIRWGVSEMGLLLTIDGRECPGCDSLNRFCEGTITTVHCPDGINVDNLVQSITQIFGQSRAFGRASNNAFYLDPAQLSAPSPATAIDLLLATGNALRQLGCKVDVSAGVGVANQILGSS